MELKGFELSALVKLGIVMAKADGRFDETEMNVIASELMNFGVNMSNAPAIIDVAAAMDEVDALTAVSAMSVEQKKYATGFLAAIMEADGKFKDSELAMWKLISTLCSFPTMTIKEALDYWRKH